MALQTTFYATGDTFVAGTKLTAVKLNSTLSLIDAALASQQQHLSGLLAAATLQIDAATDTVNVTNLAILFAGRRMTGALSWAFTTQATGSYALQITTEGVAAINPVGSPDATAFTLGTVSWTLTTTTLASATVTATNLAALNHTHSNKTLLDTYTQTEADLADAVSKKHAHTNGALLDSYDQTNVDLTSAVAMKHDVSYLGTKQVDEAAIADGKFLKYDSASGKLIYAGVLSGPTSVVDGQVAVFDGTSGAALKNVNIKMSGYLITLEHKTLSTAGGVDGNGFLKYTGNGFYFGDNANTLDKYLSVLNNAANNPALRYHVETAKWQFSNDGTTFTDMGSGGTGGHTDEEIQDLVGGLLTDSNTVTLTYDDASPLINAEVVTQLSVTSDAGGVKLVNDNATPGNSKYYGTNSSGTKGYHDLPTSSGGGVPPIHIPAEDWNTTLSEAPYVNSGAPTGLLSVSDNANVLAQWFDATTPGGMVKSKWVPDGVTGVTATMTLANTDAPTGDQVVNLFLVAQAFNPTTRSYGPVYDLNTVRVHQATSTVSNSGFSVSNAATAHAAVNYDATARAVTEGSYSFGVAVPSSARVKYISSNGGIIEFGTTGTIPGGTSIAGLMVRALVWDASGSVYLAIKSGSSQSSWVGTAGTSYFTAYAWFPTDPATGAAWTPTAANAAKMILNNGGSGGCYAMETVVFLDAPWLVTIPDTQTGTRAVSKTFTVGTGGVQLDPGAWHTFYTGSLSASEQDTFGGARGIVDLHMAFS